MPHSDRFLLPPKYVWLAAIPLFPLILGAVFLSSLISPGEHLSFLTIYPFDYLGKTAREFTHLGDMLIYSSFVSVHVVICVGVIVYLANMIRGLPSRARRSAVVFTGVVALSLVCLISYFAWKANDIVIVQLGYKSICMAIEMADLSTNLASKCFEQGGFTTLTWLAWVPAFSGMGAVVFAAGFAYGNADDLPAFKDAEWRAVFNKRVRGLQKSLYALSLVLVSSTIAITVFAHLPAGLLNNSHGLATAVSKYAIGLSTFWGALFTLTLAATYVAPTFLLLRQAYAHQSRDAAGVDLRVWLHEHVFISIRKQLVNVASLLAPLLVGPLSSLLTSFAGA